VSLRRRQSPLNLFRQCPSLQSPLFGSLPADMLTCRKTTDQFQPASRLAFQRIAPWVGRDDFVLRSSRAFSRTRKRRRKPLDSVHRGHDARPWSSRSLRPTSFLRSPPGIPPRLPKGSTLPPKRRERFLSVKKPYQLLPV